MSEAYLPCAECGKPAFQLLTTRGRKYCSQNCAKRAWNRANPRVRRTPQKVTDHYSLTITYTDAEGRLMTRVGTGRSKLGASEDARAQLPSWFVPVSEYRSTPSTIRCSLKRSAA